MILSGAQRPSQRSARYCSNHATNVSNSSDGSSWTAFSSSLTLMISICRSPCAPASFLWIPMGHGGCNPPPRSRSAGGEVGELVVDETQEEFLGGVVVEALDGFDGETAGDELAGADGIDAAGLEIEDFLVVDL